MVVFKNKFKDTAAIKLLAFIVAATESAAGHAFAPADKVKEIAAAQPSFLAIDESVKNAEGQVKVTSTAAAKAALEAAASAPATATPAIEIKLEDSIPVPEGKRGPTRVEVYPFSKMAVGQSFLVSATPERPNPAKALSSTVGSATKRFNEPVVDEAGKPVMEDAKKRDGSTFQRQKMKQTRKFVIRPVEGGARIWRTV